MLEFLAPKWGHHLPDLRWSSDTTQNGLSPRSFIWRLALLDGLSALGTACMFVHPSSCVKLPRNLWCPVQNYGKIIKKVKMATAER